MRRRKIGAVCGVDMDTTLIFIGLKDEIMMKQPHYAANTSTCTDSMLR